jgi:hypothetical protein
MVSARAQVDLGDQFRRADRDWHMSALQFDDRAGCGRHGGIMTLRELFDGAQSLGADVTLWERDTPGAIDELRRWAADRNLPVVDRTHTVPDDYPLVEWRGMWVSTVAAGRIHVHRERPDERAA